MANTTTFAPPTAFLGLSTPQAALNVLTPGSGESSNTFLMSASPVKASKRSDAYKPKIITTVGQRPACLVNASVTYVGNNQIYAFGGFDQYTDEVYNHVLKLDLNSRRWSLVDNYGDIPGVRMGHTANLWQGNKLLVYGGENEHRAYLSDVIIFDLETAYWTQPELHGPAPRGRARHSAVIHDDKLYISGGMTGHDSYVLDDVCYLDLKTWTWSRSWRFVPRYDHASWVWNNRLWVFGGICEDMERISDIWWLDLKSSPAFEVQMAYGATDRQGFGRLRAAPNQSLQPPTSSNGNVANTGTLAIAPNPHAAARQPPVAPGSVSSLKFVSSPYLPIQTIGTHFHLYSSGYLLDFVTPATVISSFETSLCALDLDTLRWQKLADGRDLFNHNYRWHYCTLNEDGTHAWLLGCPTDPSNPAANGEEFLSDVLPIDLRKLGLMGNQLTLESRAAAPVSEIPASSGIGADLALMFESASETGDFIITANRDEDDDLSDDEHTPTASVMDGTQPSQPHSNKSEEIHVHNLILQARWPHFRRLYKSQMIEFQTKRMHIPEPFSAVRAFLYFLYTDSIAPHPKFGPDIDDVAGMLVMANIYDIPRLRHLCVDRLGKELDIDHAAFIWERAGTAGEDWLRKRAASFCMTHWGRIVRTPGFRNLKKAALMELCEQVDIEGRVVDGEELEAVGGLGGGRLGFNYGRESRKRRAGSESVSGMTGDETAEEEEADEEGMEIS